MSAHVRFLISCYLDAIVEPMVSGDYSSAIMILREPLSCKLRAVMAFNRRAERPKQQS